MEKIEHATPDITQANIERLVELFPQVATEVKDESGVVKPSIDFDALRDLLGDVAEGQRERYQFTWPGKAEAKLEARKPCDKTLRPHPEKSVDWDSTQNLYIEGDNLEALKIMRETYAGKIKLIYIDPPYNTGHDFIYDDDFSQTREDYDSESGDYNEEGGRLVANPESNGRFHSDWCSMMYPRLLLARDLLTSDGAIFISIDESENFNLREILNEIFGADNFIGEIAWAGGRKNDSKYISISHEYVLCYVRDASYLSDQAIRWRKKKAGLTEIYREETLLRSKYEQDYTAMSLALKAWYKNLPEGSPSMAHSHYSKIDDKGIYFPDNLSWPGGGGPKYEVLHPITHKPVTIPSRGWLFGSQKRMQDMIDQGLIEFGPDETKVPCYKRYLKETEYEAPYSVIYKDGRGASKRLAQLMGNKVFDNPKDEETIADFISYLGLNDGIVMDFFSGSGTTAHATFLRNAIDGTKRKFILVQLPESLEDNLKRAVKASSKKVLENAIALCNELHLPRTICSIAEERIRRAGAKIKLDFEEANKQPKLGEGPKSVPDIGFRVFSIDSSNFLDTYSEPGEQTQASLLSLVDNLKEDRTPEDLLFQVLPAFRIPYSAHIEKMEVAGATCFNVNDGQLIACFDMPVSTDAIEKIARMKPIYAVFRDASFASDSDAANFDELFKTYSPDTVRRVI